MVSGVYMGSAQGTEAQVWEVLIQLSMEFERAWEIRNRGGGSRDRIEDFNH